MRVAAALVLSLILPAAGAEVILIVPDEALAGEPIFGSIDVVDAGVRQMHQNMLLRAWLDDTLVFESESIHEHDGFHTFVLTAPSAGALRLQVETPSGAEEASTSIGAASAPDPWSPVPTLATEVVAGTVVVRPQEPVPGAIQWDDRGADGRLTASAWIKGDAIQDSLFYAKSNAFGASVDARFVSAGDDAPRPLVQAQHAYNDAAVTVPVLPGVSVVPCVVQAGALVTDPESLAVLVPTWQAGVDIRVALPGWSGELAVYQVGSLAGPDGTTHILSLPTTAPGAPATFAVREPGAYSLTVVEPMGAPFNGCGIEFIILPPPDLPPGSVEHAINVTDDQATIQFTPYDADGAILGHYEFDTRVYRLAAGDDPGRFVWQGKLHGHGGTVEFTLGGLEPGDYEVRTYPSPQAVDMASVAADGPDGFLYRFTVAEPEPVAPVEEASEPTPAGALVALAALGMAVLARRRL